MPTPAQRLDLAAISRLDFEEPDLERFPALRLAREALEARGSAPAVLNAANEIAVAAFLDGGIKFPDIARLVDSALQENDRPAPQSIEDVFEIDRDVRRSVTLSIEERCA
jgi:1-deoxy-D-xylulose-5-phosphate reductoisomerase